MKFLKNNFKVIIGFVVGVILASGITVYAYGYIASDVQYTNDKSVADALDDLYSNMSNETKTITTNGQQTLDKYYKNFTINVQPKWKKEMPRDALRTNYDVFKNSYYLCTKQRKWNANDISGGEIVACNSLVWDMGNGNGIYSAVIKTTSQTLTISDSNCSVIWIAE